MLTYVLIFFASGVGGVLRFCLTGVLQYWWGPTFPFGTIVVNVTGCLGIGCCAALFAGPYPIRDEFRLAIIVGLFGGYTTFSTFGRETQVLAHQGEWTRAGLYVLLTNLLGLLAVWIGATVATKLGGPSSP